MDNTQETKTAKLPKVAPKDSEAGPNEFYVILSVVTIAVLSTIVALAIGISAYSQNAAMRKELSELKTRCK